MSSSNAVAAPQPSITAPIGFQVDPISEYERPLIGAIFRLGTDALELAVLNHVTATDFSDEACSELFELARRVRLSGRPIVLAELADDIGARGLTQTATVAIQAAALVTLSDVPVLAYGLVTWSGFRGMMRGLSAGHSSLTATMDVSGHPRDLLEAFNRILFELHKHAQRWKDLL